jgi:hypothetical protein
MKPNTYRRVVTVNIDGKAAVQSDEQIQAYEFKSKRPKIHENASSN